MKWVRLSRKGIKQVRPKAVKLLENDDFVTHLARDAFHITWSRSTGFGGMGDHISHSRSLRVSDSGPDEEVVEARKPVTPASSSFSSINPRSLRLRVPREVQNVEVASSTIWQPFAICSALSESSLSIAASGGLNNSLLHRPI
jgi:hypothetical protein